MMDLNPYPLSKEDWRQIVAVPAVRAAWGLDGDGDPDEFAGSVYGVRFKFVSGSPGYVGDLFILRGDSLAGDPPMVLRRGEDGSLLPS